MTRWWTGITKRGAYSTTLHVQRSGLKSLCGKAQISGDSTITHKKCKRCEALLAKRKRATTLSDALKANLATAAEVRELRNRAREIEKKAEKSVLRAPEYSAFKTAYAAFVEAFKPLSRVLENDRAVDEIEDSVYDLVNNIHERTCDKPHVAFVSVLDDLDSDDPQELANLLNFDVAALVDEIGASFEETLDTLDRKLSDVRDDIFEREAEIDERRNTENSLVDMKEKMRAAWPSVYEAPAALSVPRKRKARKKTKKGKGKKKARR